MYYRCGEETLGETKQSITSLKT